MARPRINTISIPDSAKSLAPGNTKIRGRATFDDNPFITSSSGFEIKVKKGFSIIAKGLEIHDQDDNEVAAGFIGTVKDTSMDQFVQIFPDYIKDIFKLKKAGSIVFQAVFLAVQKYAINKADIYLNYNTCLKLFEEYNIEPPSHLTFKRGIATLIDSGFIACSSKGEHWYWTNPNILFNGNRYTFVQQYRIKRMEEKTGIKQNSLLEYMDKNEQEKENYVEIKD